MQSQLLALLPGLERLWAMTLGEANICVAILDGPVDCDHPCFRGAQLNTCEVLVAAKPATGSAAEHGTHVTSLIFGQHGGPVNGIAPRCRGLLIPVFRSGPDGRLQACGQLELARAITHAAEAGAQVISISAGQLDQTGEPLDYLNRAISLCADRNILLVAAAGNDGCDCVHVPAAVTSVLSVGAMDSAGLPLETSNWGAAYRANGVLAPGQEILGAIPGGVTKKSGTSFSTAIVSGIAALLLSVQSQEGQTPDPTVVRSAILAGVLPCELKDEARCQRFLAGRINIHGALASLTATTRTNGSSNASSPHLKDARPSSQINGENYMQTVQLLDNRVQTVESTNSQEHAKEATSVDPTPTFEKSRDSRVGAITPSDCACGGACGCGGGCGGKCGCGGATPKPPLVYALGELSYDFQTEARRDSLVQNGLSSPSDPTAVVSYLSANPESATALTWVLLQESTPMYAVQPIGAFAAQTYEVLRRTLDAQQKTDGVEILSVPGYLAGKTTLMNGQSIPVIAPESRGIFSWSVRKLVEAVSGAEPKAKSEREDYRRKNQDIHNFLERVYYEIRNLGLTSSERAMNYAATNAFQIDEVFRSAIAANLKLDTIQTERSPICRPESDCWDVKLTFFNPMRRYEQARHVYRFTIDVSDVVPVTVGRIREWDVY